MNNVYFIILWQRNEITQCWEFIIVIILPLEMFFLKHDTCFQGKFCISRLNCLHNMLVPQLIYTDSTTATSVIWFFPLENFQIFKIKLSRVDKYCVTQDLVKEYISLMKLYKTICWQSFAGSAKICVFYTWCHKAWSPFFMWSQ